MPDFHSIIKAAALAFARENAIVMPGDFVLTQWGRWKKPHKVQISQVGAALACGKFDPEKREFHASLEMTYYAWRLKADGKPRERYHGGIALTSFVTEAGEKWQQSKQVISHAAVHWELPESLVMRMARTDLKPSETQSSHKSLNGSEEG